MSADRKPPTPLLNYLKPGRPPRWRLVPTLRCNVGCSYCSSDVRLRYVHSSNREILPGDWIEIIRAIDEPYVITGGEPFLYRGLSEVVAAAGDRPMRINTNLLVVTPDDLERLSQRGNVTLRVTFHFGQPGWFWTIRHAIRQSRELLQVPNLNVRLLAVRTPRSEAADRAFRAAGVDIKLIPDSREGFVLPPYEGVVRCTRSVRLLGPDGQRWPCWHHMKEATSMVLHGQATPFTIICHDYGQCSLCDRFCQIEEVMDG